MSAAERAAARVVELRARRAARAAERAAFEERREHGLRARHAAKLAHFAARERTEEEPTPDTPDSEGPEPDAA